MSELELAAIRRRWLGTGQPVPEVARTETFRDVQALLDRIAELEAENALLRRQREHLGTVGIAAVREADALRSEHAAAMALVRVMAGLAPGDWPVRHLELSNDLVEQARSLVASQAGEETVK